MSQGRCESQRNMLKCGMRWAAEINYISFFGVNKNILLKIQKMGWRYKITNWKKFLLIIFFSLISFTTYLSLLCFLKCSNWKLQISKPLDKFYFPFFSSTIFDAIPMNILCDSTMFVCESDNMCVICCRSSLHWLHRFNVLYSIHSIAYGLVYTCE